MQGIYMSLSSDSTERNGAWHVGCCRRSGRVEVSGRQLGARWICRELWSLLDVGVITHRGDEQSGNP